MEQMNSKKYRKVPKTSANTFDTQDATENSAASRHASSAGRFQLDKIIWIVVGAVLLYFSKIYTYIFNFDSSKTSTIPLYGFYVFSAMFGGLFLYLNYYLPMFCGIIVTARHWQRDAPKLVTATTIAGLLAFCSLFIACWPVYRFWSFLLHPLLLLSLMAFLSFF